MALIFRWRMATSVPSGEYSSAEAAPGHASVYHRPMVACAAALNGTLWFALAFCAATLVDAPASSTALFLLWAVVTMLSILVLSVFTGVRLARPVART